MTEYQQRLLNLIANASKKMTYREMMEQTGIKSSSQIYRYLNKMKSQGIIKENDRMPCGWQVIDPVDKRVIIGDILDPKWILFDEVKPQKDGICLVKHENGRMNYYQAYYHVDEGLFTCMDSDGLKCYTLLVTHWYPLP